MVFRNALANNLALASLFYFQNKTTKKAARLAETRRIRRQLQVEVIFSGPRFQWRKAVHKRKWILTAASLSLAIAGCTSKVLVRHIPPSPPNASAQTRPAIHGVVYALPRTVLEVTVPLIKTTYKKGNYCPCTGDLFPGENFERKACGLPDVVYHVEAAAIASKGEPDPNQIYFYEVAGGWMESRNAGFTFTDDLLLTDGEVETTNNTVDVALKVLTTAATILSKVALADVPECTADLRKSAENAFERISAIEKQRATLLSNAATSQMDGTALSLALKELDSRAASLKEREFFGSKKDEMVWIGTFESRPESHPTATSLFEFMTEKGLCGEKFSPLAINRTAYEDKEADCDKNKVRRVTLSFERIKDQIADAMGESNDDSNEYGFRYRVPARYVIKINEFSDDGKAKQLARAEVPIAQLGMVVALPASTGSKRTKYTLALSPITGAPKNFKLGTDALITKAAIEDVSGAVNTLLDARKKQLENQGKEADELAQLQRKRQILEEQLKIIEAEEKLKEKDK